MGKMIQVAVVEDVKDTRENLVRVISADKHFQVSATASTLTEGLALLSERPADVLLVDLGLPDGSGIDLIRNAAERYEDMDIMVITVFGDERNVVRAIEAGASGYLLKDGETETIAESIMQLVEGGSPISPGIARYLLKRFQSPSLSPSSPSLSATDTGCEKPDFSLTKREQEVLNLIAKGFRYDEIAELLSLSTHTITSHIKNLYKKLAVHSRGEAVFEATRLGLLTR